MNPYEPFEIAERLLWLSNLEENADEIHCALVDAGTCAFLVQVPSYTGGLDPHDRGICRIKGLAMPCAGNILKKIDGAQLRYRVPPEMIGIVATIKDNLGATTVQRGQAIFLLQRYTLVADKYGIVWHYAVLS